MENHLGNCRKQRKRRTLRVRKRVRGNENRPRLSVFRSNKNISAQIIDDERGITLVGMGTQDKEVRGTPLSKKNKEAAKDIGKRIAAEAKKKKIEKVVFDRGNYRYQGLVAQLAEGAREAGLDF